MKMLLRSLSSLVAVGTATRLFFPSLSLVVPNMLVAASAFSSSSSGPHHHHNKPTTNIVVVGGTHGNEYTGVWCIRELEAQRQQMTEPYSSLQVQTLLGNPQAHAENKRFIHSDLNREFTAEKLLSEEECPVEEEECFWSPSWTVEAQRARELNELLGPKFGSQENGDHTEEEEETRTHVIVDLHSTTANMGLALIVPEGDTLMTQAAAYVMYKCGGEVNHTRVLMHALPHRHHRPNLGSTGRHGFTIEVGPVPQGVLRHDAVEKTRTAMHYLFEFLDRHNAGERDAILKEMREKVYKDGTVPCFRSAPAKRPGELSGKIAWPSHPENPNFPAVLVHKSLQDKDFHVLKTGDPIFVTLDGKIENYTGSHGDSVYVIFVNEGGYYYESSGTGIGVAVKTAYNLQDGTFVPCDEKNNGDNVCQFE